ncbi:DUF4124 domain-containing protein [Neisseriaceae bacterium TC5R-5]|nr:DUF4124 domain-containing protein [Neisseriaceae bacterium TC5R-5]
MKKLAACCLLIVTSWVQAATVYRYVDKEGNVTFTNIPIRGAQAIQLSPLPSVPSPPNNRSNNTVKPSSSYPAVDPATQKQRDGGRRKILEQELANEEKALAAAQQALTEGKAVRYGNETRNHQRFLDRIQKLQDEVTDRQKNVDALRRELSKN